MPVVLVNNKSGKPRAGVVKDTGYKFLDVLDIKKKFNKDKFIESVQRFVLVTLNRGELDEPVQMQIMQLADCVVIYRDIVKGIFENGVSLHDEKWSVRVNPLMKEKENCDRNITLLMTQLGMTPRSSVIGTLQGQTYAEKRDTENKLSRLKNA